MKTGSGGHARNKRRVEQGMSIDERLVIPVESSCGYFGQSKPRSITNQLKDCKSGMSWIERTKEPTLAMN